MNALLRHLSPPEIAAELGLSPHTIDAHLKSARHKLGATSSRQAARMAAALDSSLSPPASSAASPPQSAVTNIPEWAAEPPAETDAAPAAFPLPVATRRTPTNMLTAGQTLIWIAVLTLALAIAFGTFLAGYEAISRLLGSSS